MSEMVERVARGLCLSKRNSPNGYPLGWLERHVNENWHLFEDDARTALTEAREPTEAMLQEGYSAACRHDYGDVVPSTEIARAVWQAMIDEALK